MFNRKKALSDRTGITYPGMVSGTRWLEMRSMTLLELMVVTLIITGICAACDYATLHSLLDDALNEEDGLIKLVTATISVVENVLPLLMVHLWVKHKYQPESYSAIPVWIIFVSLAILFGLLFYMRWMDMESAFDMIGVEEKNYDKKVLLNQAITLVMGVMPILTSVGNGALAYGSPNVYDRRYNALRIRIFELRQQLADVDTTIKVLEDREALAERLRKEDQAGFEAAVDETKAQLKNMRDYADLKLTAHLSNPNALSWINRKRKEEVENND